VSGGLTATSLTGNNLAAGSLGFRDAHAYPTDFYTTLRLLAPVARRSQLRFLGRITVQITLAPTGGGIRLGEQSSL